MRQMALACAALAGLVSLSGCGWIPGTSPAQHAGGLAVVDLDEIAKTFGQDARFKDMVKIREANWNNGLTSLNSKLNEELKEKKQEFGDELTPEQIKELKQNTLAASYQVQQAKAKAQSDLVAYTETLKQQFRSQVRPVAQEVAAKRGFSIVIPKNEGLLLSVAPENDITADVIKALQAQGSKATPAAPKPIAENKDAKPVEKKAEKKETADAAPEKTPASETR